MNNKNHRDYEDNKHLRKYILGKILLIALIWISYYILMKALSPITAVNVALGQFSNTSNSFSDMQLINIIKTNEVLLPIFLTLIIVVKTIIVIKK